MINTFPTRWFHSLPDFTKAALFMTGTAFCFACMGILIRMVSETIPPFEIGFFRNFFATICMLPWFVAAKFPVIARRNYRPVFARAIVGIVGMGVWFSCVAYLPLSEAVALNFTLPLFVLMGASVFLGEKVGIRRWSATFVGFVGMLIILRPGLVEFSPLMLLPILAAVFMAISLLLLKFLANREPPNTNVFYQNLLMTPLSLIPAVFIWQWPGLYEMSLMAAIGAISVVAHLCLARCYIYADTSAVMPFDYARLPFIALLAYLFFGEVADIWTWLGAGIIASSSLYIAHREAKLAKSQKQKPQN